MLGDLRNGNRIKYESFISTLVFIIYHNKQRLRPKRSWCINYLRFISCSDDKYLLEYIKIIVLHFN